VGGLRLSLPDVDIRRPQNNREQEACYRLRWEVLRAPWQQPHGSERDKQEDSARHYLAIDAGNKVLATGRIHSLEAATAQIRYMAVHPDYQRHGLGQRLLKALEADARHYGERHIILHARENSVEFYRHCGYRVIRRSHRLFDAIQHYEMEKHLPEDPA
jgi:N-acetylglutamate synthase-like GNAT family acetyltransferase